MKRILICGFLLAVGLGIVVLPFATAAPAVKGTGVAFHLAPDLGGAMPPVKHDGLVVGAKGTIHRTDNGVTINIHTVGLTHKHAYTVWVMFGISGPFFHTFITKPFWGLQGIST